MSKVYFKALGGITNGKAAVCITVASGTYIGKHALWSEGGFVYTDEGVNWQQLEGALQADIKDGLLQQEGVDYYFEKLQQEERLIICGAGHISVPLVQMGKMLDFRVISIDDRADFVKNTLKAGADEGISKPFAEALGGLAKSENDYYVIVTRGHQYDRECLKNILHYPRYYVGMIGSKSRVRAIMADFLEAGEDAEALAEVHSPIGLSIGAKTPEEIAVSIMAEIVQERNKTESKGWYGSDMLEALVSDEYEGMGMSLVSIVGKNGSAPRGIGAKMLVLQDGSIVGTIGGGCVEGGIINLALRSISYNKVFRQSFNLSGEAGMFCGGMVDVLVEPVSPAGKI